MRLSIGYVDVARYNSKYSDWNLSKYICLTVFVNTAGLLNGSPQSAPSSSPKSAGTSEEASPSAYCDVIGLLLERHCKHLLGSFAAPEQAALCWFCPTIYSLVFLMCSCRSSGSREPTSLPTFTGFLWRCCSACGQIVFHLVIIGFQSICSSHCRWLASRLILWQDSAKLCSLAAQPYIWSFQCPSMSRVLVETKTSYRRWYLRLEILACFNLWGLQQLLDWEQIYFVSRDMKESKVLECICSC